MKWWQVAAAIAVGVIGYEIGRLVKICVSRPMLDFLEKNYNYPLVGVEIGVYRGGNALRMLNRLPIETLYLVDPYVQYLGYNDSTNWELKMGFPTAQDCAIERLSPYADRTIFLNKFSDVAICDIPNGLDFVYIDGNHSYEYVKNDIENFYPKVHRGGIIGGHDIQIKDVERAAVGFAYKHDLELNIKHPDWWLIKK